MSLWGVAGVAGLPPGVQRIARSIMPTIATMCRNISPDGMAGRAEQPAAGPRHDGRGMGRTAKVTIDPTDTRVMYVGSEAVPGIDPFGNGSSAWTRTRNPPVNSRMLYH